MTIEGQRDLNDEPVKTIAEIRQKRKEYLNEAFNPRNQQGLLITPGSREVEQDPETMLMCATILTWVLGEETRAIKDWDHESPAAKGWLVIPESERAYVEKPTGASFSMPGWEANQTDEQLGYTGLFGDGEE